MGCRDRHPAPDRSGHPQLSCVTLPGWVPSNQDIARINAELGRAVTRRVTDFVMPGGNPIGQQGGNVDVRVLQGGMLGRVPAAARQRFKARNLDQPVLGIQASPREFVGTTPVGDAQKSRARRGSTGQAKVRRHGAEQRRRRRVPARFHRRGETVRARCPTDRAAWRHRPAVGGAVRLSLVMRR